MSEQQWGWGIMFDKRTRLQRRLDNTRWQPFCYISPSNFVIIDPHMKLYRDAALITTAIIARMMFTVCNEKKP